MTKITYLRDKCARVRCLWLLIRTNMTRKQKCNRGDSESRRNAVSITLSDRELAAIDEYCATFGGRSRAAVIREGAIRFVRAKLIDRHTCLFPEDIDLPAPKMPKASEPLPSLFDFADGEQNDD